MPPAIPRPPVIRRPPLLRLAQQIHAQLTSRTPACPADWLYGLEDLSARTRQLARIRRRLALCQHHGFVLATRNVQQELCDVLRQIPAALETLTRQVAVPTVSVLPVREIAAELTQLQEEFGDWHLDAPRRELVVVTEAIELEDQPLGAFEIRLALQTLGRTPVYKIVALEPHPAASNPAVTHPHVSDERLCAGDATVPIQSALTQGRLAEFFLLVRGVLTSYNPASPYVALSDWQGEPCQDCGAVTDADGRYYCEACNQDFCDACIAICQVCDTSLCQGCLQECPVCEQRVCRGCLAACPTCGQRACRSCLEDCCLQRPVSSNPSQGESDASATPPATSIPPRPPAAAA